MKPKAIPTNEKQGKAAPAFSAEFWLRFAGEHWERRPVLIKQAFATALFTPEEAFQTLVKAGDQYRAGDRTLPAEFYIEYAHLLAGDGEHLPRADDRTCAGYAERVTRQIGGRRFALIAEDIQAHDARLWMRLREFMRGLHEAAGIPRCAAKATVFFGNYEKTPFGLHDGESSNFKFMIEGRKKMQLWPDAFFRGKVNARNTFDYERHLDGATTIEGGPGDVIYWPSDCWHIGEPVGGLAVSLSLALFPNSRLFAPEDLWQSATRRAEERLQDLAYPPEASSGPARLRENVKAIPGTLDLTKAALKEALEEPQLQQAVTVKWLNRWSGSGFDSVPPPLPREPLEGDAMVHGDPRHPVVWLPAADAEMICSANWHAFSTAAHPGIVRLLERLNSGEACRVRALVDEYAGTAERDDMEFEATADDICGLLEKLLSLRAISRHRDIAPPEPRKGM